mmetsp:Transcript_13662/g.57086  ORF Transcript_13662/g.57086 Transcript_13662/m.57086 type:complete len:205 (+) Transcript_13662:589-1203(+)
MKGDMVSSTSILPHRKPMPVGPHILCPLATIQSAPRACTSTGMWGTLWHASSSTFAPTPRAAAMTLSTGLTHPSVLDTWAMETSLVRSLIMPSMAASSSMPVAASSGAWRSTQPVRSATSCHGTRLEWCSITVSTTSSPSSRLSSPHAYATRLMASLALRVHTISRSDVAFTKVATLPRAASYSSVARAARACTPRCTLELYSA